MKVEGRELAPLEYAIHNHDFNMVEVLLDPIPKDLSLSEKSKIIEDRINSDVSDSDKKNIDLKDVLAKVSQCVYVNVLPRTENHSNASVCDTSS